MVGIGFDYQQSRIPEIGKTLTASRGVMFQIIPQDIANLDDEKLRGLVGQLCEAEMRIRGYSSTYITYGGDQNAPDGGIDVRASIPSDRAIEGFIPRHQTGFQVKKPDMPKNAIEEEMCPGGVLRPTIVQLAEAEGAYIIATASSVSDSVLKNRIEAMRGCVGNYAGRLQLDFYDRTRLASWANSHSGISIWVRREVGRAVPGWEPFGAWAHPAGGTAAEYLSEHGVKVRDRSAREIKDLDTIGGLEKIRAALAQPNSVVRLVGLSGVGKTRFAQALFDSRLGENALDPALAVYTNIGNEPNPAPFNMASDLIANGRRIILVVDNCGPDLHQRLSTLVKSLDSQLSLLTIEYDIQDDLPEGTEAFEIRAGSQELIEALLKKRFPQLSQIDARTAAQASGGNARIAIALAETVERKDTLGSLNDLQLFERLFAQRQGQDKTLLEVAQACSLVYSFNGEDVDDGSELPRIAKLAGVPVEVAHRNVAQLIRRDLAQRRGRWRAVLPHALANRLAQTGLQSFSKRSVENAFKYGAPERLTISFARRLGFLDANREAVDLVTEWLQPKGWIGAAIWNLNQFGRSMLLACLPAAPAEGLAAMEANIPAYDADNPITTGEYLPRLLRSLAWDGSLFERCIHLLEVLALHGEGAAKEAQDVHRSLFYIVLSGTHATLDQRLEVVSRLLNAGEPKARSLGISALGAMIHASHFHSAHDFQFGSHSRDYGYNPSNRDEISLWFRKTLALAEQIAFANIPASTDVQALIADDFRELWMIKEVRNALENFCLAQVKREPWREGWKAVRQTRHYDAKDRASESYARLTRLEEALRPNGLIETVRAKALSSFRYDPDDLDLEDVKSFTAAHNRQLEVVKDLGRKVVADENTFEALLDEIVSAEGNNWSFAEGLAEAAADRPAIWGRIVDKIRDLPSEKINTRLFAGFLAQTQRTDPQQVDLFLNGALDERSLAMWYPLLLIGIPLTTRRVQLLIQSLDIGAAAVHLYSNLHLGNVDDEVSEKLVTELLEHIAGREGGVDVGVHLLGAQFWSDHQEKRPVKAERIEVGRRLLQSLPFNERQRENYYLSTLVKTCLTGKDGKEIAVSICRTVRDAVARHKISGFDENELLKALCVVQPSATLDGLLTGDQAEIRAGVNLLTSAAYLRSNPIDTMSETALMDWCKGVPESRFRLAAAVASIYSQDAEFRPLAWNPIGPALVHASPDPIATMREVIARMRPMSWSGSRAFILESNADLVENFDVGADTALRSFISSESRKLREEAKISRAAEEKRSKEEDERFEY